ncbi:MAG: magnesium transporter CorA family protein [Candidatus Limnocylindria bacterium]
MSIRALLSRADGSDTDFDPADLQARRVKGDELLWVDLEAPSADELEAIREALRLAEDSAEAIGSDPTSTGAHVLEDGVEVVVLALDEDLDADPVPLRVVIGDGWVISQHAEPISFIDEHRESIQDQREVGRLTPVEFLVSLLDWHVDAYFHAAEQLEREVDELDDAALRTDRDILDRLVAMRRRIARVRRIIAAHTELAAELSRPDFLPESAQHGTDALGIVAKRLARAADAVSNARDMLIGTFDVHMTRTAQRTNDTMRLLTLASVILLPSVVLAGIMGMNFKVGLFDQSNLFWVVIGAMVAMAVATLGIARWRGWL